MSIEQKKRLLKLERKQKQNVGKPIKVIYLNDWRTGEIITEEEAKKRFATTHELLFVKYTNKWRTAERGSKESSGSDNELYRG